MAGATTTIREVKNKDTGIDLTVNNYKETKAMIGSTYEYQVMVVSGLNFFKTAKHKESDNVQFTVLKKFNEFEELYNKLNTKFSGTVFPPLPKKVLMMNEVAAKERRAGLDQIVKYIASTPKICTSSILLEFLGVSSIKAGKFRKMEVSDATVDRDESKEEEGKDTAGETEGQAEKKEAEEDLFEDGTEGQEQDNDDDDLFADDNAESNTAESTKIFEDQDLSGAFDEGEAEDLFLPDAKVERTTAAAKPEQQEEEESDDLFRIEDDNLDEIMHLNLKPKSESEDADIEIEAEAVTEQTDDAESTQQDVEEEVVTEEVPSEEIDEKQEEPTLEPAKPVLKPKPKLAAKPKPPLKAKPNLSAVNTNSPLADTDSKSSQSEKVLQQPVPSARPKPPLKQKPQLATKPVIKPKPKPAPAPVEEPAQSLGGLPSENISEDDIMKYIQANTADDDVDLFS